MKKAVMYGAGNIGRGFIGQLFSESGYEVAFIDVNMDIINKLNSDGQYPIGVLSGTESQEITVRNVKGVDGRDIGQIAAAIAEADIMATAIGVNILPRIAKPIAEGLKKRWQSGRTDPLNIIICENLLDANHYLANLIGQELNDEENRNFEKLVGLVEASIGRMVPVMTPDMQQGNILRICVEEFGELPVDKDGFKGEIPNIKNMQPASPFSYYIQRKLFIHNMGHALTAYLGQIKGCEYIWQAIGDPYIKLAVMRAMQDSARALSLEHGIRLDTILDHVDDLIYRFGNKQLGDTVNRVGNDVKRKLSPNDRLVGAANLCLAHGINPANITLGIAAAMKFDIMNVKLNGINDMITSEGPEGVLKNLCRVPESSVIYEQSLMFYNMMSNFSQINTVIEKTAEIKRKKAV